MAYAGTPGGTPGVGERRVPGGAGGGNGAGGNSAGVSVGGGCGGGGNSGSGNVGSGGAQTRLQATFEAIKKMSAGLTTPRGEASPKRKDQGQGREEVGYFDVVVEGEGE